MTSIRTGSWQIRVIMALMLVSLVAACGGDGGTATSAAGTETTGAVSETTAGADTTAGAGGELTPLAVGVIPITDVVPLYVAIEQGLFEEAGLEVTPTLAEGGAAIIPGVEAGEFQIGFSNVVSLVNATAAGIQLQALTGGMKANEEEPDWSAVLVGADSDISDASGLAGQTIAVNTLANIGEVTIRASLDGQDVDTSGLQFIELGFPDMPAALAEGQVEAIWVVEPFVTIATAEGAQVVDYNYIGTEPGMEIAAYFTTTEYAEANPDVVEAFVGAITAAEEMITADEQVARDAVTTYTSLTPELAAEILFGPFTGTLDTDSITNTADLMVQYEVIEEVPDLTGLLGG